MNGHKLDAAAGGSLIASFLMYTQSHLQDIYSILSIIAVLLAIVLYGLQIWQRLNKRYKD